MEKVFRIRCSSLHAIIGEPQSKSAREAGELSQTAKSEVHRLVRYHIFGYEPPQLNGKEIQKGIRQEGVAIDTLSIVTGELYTKNQERRFNEWITGECDLVAHDHGVDIKCPWSAETFPLTSEQAMQQAVKSGYDIQAAGYMMLWDKPRWAISYVLVDTPSDLLPIWEDTSVHDVSMNLPPQHRVTSCWFERDMGLEEKIKTKCKAAQKYAQELIEKFYKEHGE